MPSRRSRRRSRCRPALSAAREELAALYAEAGRAPEGIVQLEAIAALEPDRPERQAAVGLAQARAGRTDLAVGVLGRAAERYPDNAVIYVALGRVWFESAERARDRVGLRKAIEALEPFTRGQSPSGEALALYGRALVLSGEAGGWRNGAPPGRRHPAGVAGHACSGWPTPPNAWGTTPSSGRLSSDGRRSRRNPTRTCPPSSSGLVTWPRGWAIRPPPRRRGNWLPDRRPRPGSWLGWRKPNSPRATSARPGPRWAAASTATPGIRSCWHCSASFSRGPCRPRRRSRGASSASPVPGATGRAPRRRGRGALPSAPAWRGRSVPRTSGVLPPASPLRRGRVRQPRQSPPASRDGPTRPRRGACTARAARMFCNSRTLPGQSYFASAASVAELSSACPPVLRTASRQNSMASGPTSSGRSLSGGTTIRTTSRRYSRSWRKRPPWTSSSSSRLVAATMRVSTRRGWFSPTRRISPSWIARSSLACARGESSPTSSRNSVPPSASSNRPGRSDAAPVKDPRAWPNSSVSKRSSLSAAQLTAQKRRILRAEPAWMARAIKLLAGAALAQDQHGVRRCGRPADLLPHLCHGAARPAEVDEAGFRVPLRRHRRAQRSDRGPDSCGRRGHDASRPRLAGFPRLAPSARRARR